MNSIDFLAWCSTGNTSHRSWCVPNFTEICDSIALRYIRVVGEDHTTKQDACHMHQNGLFFYASFVGVGLPQLNHPKFHMQCNLKRTIYRGSTLDDSYVTMGWKNVENPPGSPGLRTPLTNPQPCRIIPACGQVQVAPEKVAPTPCWA